MKRVLTGLLALAATVAAASEPPTALMGGVVHTVSGAVLDGATVLIEGDHIAAVGRDLPLPGQVKKIDITGLHVYPALFSADTVLGLSEIGAVRATVDTSEVGEVNPDVRAELAMNPDSEILPVTRSNGVLLALTAPRGGLLAGTSAVIRLDGWTWEDMTVKAPAALHVMWPSMALDHGPDAATSLDDQQEAVRKRIERLQQAFAEARAYLKARDAESEKGVPQHDADARWEAMRPALAGKIPVVVHAQGVKEMRAAIVWAASEKLHLVIAGGRDAGRLVKELKDADVAVIVDPILQLPARDYEPYDGPYTLPARLHRAGVRFAIALGGSAGNVWDTRNLVSHAAMAAAFGLDHDQALRAITLSPAEILGVADRLGSLDPGKEATFFVADGDPLDIRTHVIKAWVGGREIDLGDRHKRLYQKYLSKPRRETGSPSASEK